MSEGMPSEREWLEGLRYEDKFPDGECDGSATVRGPMNGRVVTLPWPCAGCGDGHDRLRTYYSQPDWYECACGQHLTAEDAERLRARAATDQTEREDGPG